MSYWEKVEEERRRKELEKLKHFKLIKPPVKDEYKETEELMRKEGKAKEKVKVEREELLRMYIRKLKELFDDEASAVEDYNIAKKMAEALGFEIDTSELFKILGDEQRHRTMVATMYGLRAGKR